jgi:hypothetical protein
VAAAERVPGGASREAWFVDIEGTDGTVQELFLRYSRVSRTAGGFHTLRGNVLAIVPRIADPLAGTWTKGLARMVKYLKEIDRWGRSFHQDELADIGTLLGVEPASIGAGRRDLARANADGLVSDEDYVRHLWRKVQRDNHLLRTASKALAERTWPSLT